MTTNRPEFKAHDDFIFEHKKIGKVTREEFIKYIRSSHEHMRKLSELIQQYNQTIDDYLNEWDGRFESFDDDVKELLTLWIQDGTMDHIINENLMSTKADKTYVDELHDTTTAQLAQTANEVNETKRLEDFTRLSEVEPVRIATFDGTNEAVHPSVVYIPSGWGTTNTKYWMAITPWPVKTVNDRNDRYECPMILTSYNGIDWFTHTSAPNPLVDLTQAQIDNGDYFSDPSIVMNGNTMEIWYRWTNGANFNETNIFRITSTNGIAWTAPELVLDALRSDSGITGTMRSQQIFYDGSKYKAIYGVLGGTGGMQYAESANPSSGVWTNVKKVVFNKAPVNFDPWHAGIHFIDGIFHMVAYDKRKALDYFTSTDGFTFDFQSTIAETNGEIISGWVDFYQSYPIKIEGLWYLFATGTLKRGRSSNRRDLVIYGGDSLENLKPIPAGGINRVLYYNESPVLNNSQGPEAVQGLIYATHKNTYTDQVTGYGMAFGANVSGPIWRDHTRKSPMTFVYDATIDASGIPPHVGMIWRNANNNKMWIATNNKVSSDWQEFNFVNGMVKQTQRTDINIADSINVSGVYRAVLKPGVGNQISYMTGVVDGQELLVINTTGTSVTLKHLNTGTGAMRLRGGADKVLANNDSARFIAVGVGWYET